MQRKENTLAYQKNLVYIKEWQKKKYNRYIFTLNKEKDQDLIELLNQIKGTRGRYIKQALRAYKETK